MQLEPLFALDVIGALRHLVDVTKLHPILVNFTAALVPVSLASDLAARCCRSESLRSTAWWTLLFAAVVTPFTAIAGWLFWMRDDNGVLGMSIHKWLGSALAVLLLGMIAWRSKLRKGQNWATVPYLLAGLLFVVALVFQGYLGGHQVFGGM